MRPRRRWANGMVIGLLVTAAICAVSHVTERFWVKDVAGMTLSQVERLSIEEQYDLLSRRFDEMHALLEPTQRQLSEGEWRLGDYGRVTSGAHAPSSLLGANSQNSYYITTARVLDSPPVKGGQTVLQPLETFFSEQGWAYERHAYELPSGDVGLIRADPGGGWSIRCRVHADGMVILQVSSAPYWANASEVTFARFNRISDRGPDRAVPGDIPEFPAWEAPLKPSSERLGVRGSHQESQ